jgi:hypothetical protein
MRYFLLGSNLLGFDHYLVIYIFQSFNSDFTLKNVCLGVNGSVFSTSLNQCSFISWRKKVILPPFQTAAGIWEQITILFYQVAPSLVTLLKIIYVSVHTSNIFVNNVSRSLILSSRYSHLWSWDFCIHVLLFHSFHMIRILQPLHFQTMFYAAITYNDHHSHWLIFSLIFQPL